MQLYGRKIGTHLVAGTQLHTWLAGPQPLFDAATMATNTEVVLVGSVLDALSLWSAGFRHVMAVAGAEGFDRSHLEAMQLAGVTRVLLGFRRGGDAADRVATALLRVGIECFAIGWPSGMDANDYAWRPRTRPHVREGDPLRDLDGARAQPRSDAGKYRRHRRR